MSPGYCHPFVVKKKEEKKLSKASWSREDKGKSVKENGHAYESKQLQLAICEFNDMFKLNNKRADQSHILRTDQNPITFSHRL